MRRNALPLAALLAALLTATAEADLVVLAPSRDNSLIQSADGSLSNALGDVFVGRTGQDGANGAPVRSLRRGLTRFDVAAAIPAGSVVERVVLAMTEIQNNNGDRTVSLHLALADWGEGASSSQGGGGAAATAGDATWLHTAYDSTFWASPGGDFQATASGSTLVTQDTSLPIGTARLFTWDSATAGNAGLVSDVQAWLDGAAGNFGWLLRGDESVGSTAKRFGSRENAAFAPTLTVTFRPVPEPASIVLLAGPAAALLLIARRRGA